MKTILNTLFISGDDSYISLDGGNARVSVEHVVKGKVPLVNLDAIVAFTRLGASPALLAECLQRNIPISFLTPSGKFQGTVVGAVNGNVVLREQQYRISDDQNASIPFARNFIIGKIFNQRWMVERYLRDHSLVVDVNQLKQLSQALQEAIEKLREVDSLAEVRGIEGNAAANYFGAFDSFILKKSTVFTFNERSRRPPMNATNALLSFAYSLLANECASALITAGLDPYVGFLHQDRPGRQSLALDLMEELRGVYADRFVLKMINKQILTKTDFLYQESGAVFLNEEGRKKFLNQWAKKKTEKLTHPFINEPIIWGMVPMIQAILLARTIRGDLDAYPPFLWK